MNEKHFQIAMSFLVSFNRVTAHRQLYHRLSAKLLKFPLAVVNRAALRASRNHPSRLIAVGHLTCAATLFKWFTQQNESTERVQDKGLLETVDDLLSFGKYEEATEFLVGTENWESHYDVS